MQDEINEKVVALSVKGAKLTAETLQKAIKRSAGTYDRGSYRKLTAVFYALFRAAAQRQKGVILWHFSTAQ